LAEIEIKSLRALVVDDHMMIRRLIETFLQEEGLQHIDLVGDSEEAEAKLEFHNYDIIFLDWNLPGRSGYSLLQSLRQERKHDRAAIVMVTAQAEERYVIEALKAGATAYIVKPVSAESFHNNLLKIVQWLERVRALQSAR